MGTKEKRRSARSSGLLTALAGSLLFGLGLTIALPVVGLAPVRAAGAAGLYQDIEAHKDKIMWRAANPEIPGDVCSNFSACDDGKPAKFVTLPPATMDGHQVGRAMYWTHMKGKDAFILEHQTRQEAYFYLLGPDGSLQKTVYVQQGQPFYLVANETGKAKFDKDKTDWSAWVMKSGAAAK